MHDLNLVCLPAVPVPPFYPRAPEAFNPEIGGISTALDVFSLGVIMWEMVTGDYPWEGLTSVAIIYQVG